MPLSVLENISQQKDEADEHYCAQNEKNDS